MAAYSVAQAKDQLPKLINKALAGEEVVITRHGKPVVEITPKDAAAESSPEEMRRINEWMKQRRNARGPVSIDSVELMRLVYEEPD